MTPYRLETVSAPAAEPLSLAEARLFLRLDGTEENTLVDRLIVTVREAAEQYLRRSLITRTLAVSFDGYVPDAVPLPMGPVAAVTGVTLISRSGESAALTEAAYRLDVAGRVVFSTIPAAHRVRIVYTAGYGAEAEDVPAAIRQGMLAHLARLFDARGEATAMPADALALLSPYRVMGV